MVGHFILLLLFPGSENSLIQIWKFGITFPLLDRYFGGFSGGSEDRESACNAGDPGSIPGSGRSPGEGNGNPPQCSCLEKSMHRGAWLATVHRVQRVRYDWAANTFTFTDILNKCYFEGKDLLWDYMILAYSVCVVRISQLSLTQWLAHSLHSTFAEWMSD